jgi:hypothetical protein
VLVNGSNTTTEKYRQNLNEMRKKCFQILKKMEQDTPQYFVFRKRGGTGDYKEAMTADLLHGYYAEINLKGVRMCS